MSSPDVQPAAAEPTRRPHTWAAKFADAFRGLKWGVRGHSSFAVHFFFTAVVLLAAALLRCNVEDWCLLLLAVGLVLTAELFNSAVETLFRGLDHDTRERAWRCLDIAAAAVLLASFVAVIIGLLVFGRCLLSLYNQEP